MDRKKYNKQYYLNNKFKWGRKYTYGKVNMTLLNLIIDNP